MLRSGLPGSVQSQRIIPEHVHGRYVYPIRLPSRDALRSFLEKEQIETKIMHEPLVSDAPVYRRHRASSDNASEVLNSSLVIPSHEKLSREQVQYIIDTVCAFTEQS